MADMTDKERRIVIKQGQLMVAQNELEKQQATFNNVAKQLHEQQRRVFDLVDELLDEVIDGE